MSGLVASFLFRFSLMCAGNIWSYVPLRALASHADIATAATGLGLSSLVLLPILLVPALLIIVHFFRQTCPRMIPIMTAGHPVRAILVIALVGTWFFIFFGGVGFSGSYGAMAQAMSIVSELLLFPLSIVWLARGTMNPTL